MVDNRKRRKENYASEAEMLDYESGRLPLKPISRSVTLEFNDLDEIDALALRIQDAILDTSFGFKVEYRQACSSDCLQSATASRLLNQLMTQLKSIRTEETDSSLPEWARAMPVWAKTLDETLESYPDRW